MGWITKALKTVTGLQAYEDRKKANCLKDEADAIKEEVERKNEEMRSKANEALSQFGKVRLQCLKDSVAPFLHYIELLGNNYKEKEYEILNEIDISTQEVKDLGTIEMNASSALKTAAVSGTLAGAALCGVPTTVTTAVGMAATASTGTAISTLSGAAATNATLAWLGGGSLATGGGGMAAGAAVLSTITWASAGVLAIASAGIIASSFYSKKYTEATKYHSEVCKYRSEMEVAWTLIEGVISRAQELQHVTEQLSDRIQMQLQYLEPLVYDFDNSHEYFVATFQKVALSVRALSELSQVPVMDKEGNISSESNLILAKTQKYLNSEL